MAQAFDDDDQRRRWLRALKGGARYEVVREECAMAEKLAFEARATFGESVGSVLKMQDGIEGFKQAAGDAGESEGGE